MINWTSVKDVMPDTVGDYLICYELFGYQCIEIAYITDDKFIIATNEGEAVEVEHPTHWVALNKPQQEE